MEEGDERMEQEQTDFEKIMKMTEYERMIQLEILDILTTTGKNFDKERLQNFLRDGGINIHIIEEIDEEKKIKVLKYMTTSMPKEQKKWLLLKLDEMKKKD